MVCGSGVSISHTVIAFIGHGHKAENISLSHTHSSEVRLCTDYVEAYCSRSIEV